MVLSCWANDVLGLGVGEDNLIDVDVTPPSCGAVDDLYDPLFASKIAHVPRGGRSSSLPPATVLGSGGGSNDLAVDEKPDEGLVLPASPADEKTDVVTIDRETGTGDRAGRAIAIKELLTSLFPLKPVTGICPGRVPTAGPLPNAVPVAFQRP